MESMKTITEIEREAAVVYRERGGGPGGPVRGLRVWQCFCLDRNGAHRVMAM